MPFGLQPLHLVIIVVVALLIFGPKRLSEVGKSLGKAWRDFREGVKDASDQFSEEAHAGDEKKLPVIPTVEVSQAPGAQTTGNFCTKCGTPYQPDHTFCAKCGNKLTVESPKNEND